MLKNMQHVTFDLTKDEVAKLDYVSRKYHFSKSDMIRTLVDDMKVKKFLKRKSNHNYTYFIFTKVLTRLNQISFIISDYDIKLGNLFKQKKISQKQLMSLRAVIQNAENDIANSVNNLSDNSLDSVEKQIRLDGNALDDILKHKKQFQHNKQLIKKLNKTQTLFQHLIDVLEVRR